MPRLGVWGPGFSYFLPLSPIHPRSIACILDAHTLYPKRMRERARSQPSETETEIEHIYMCVHIYVHTHRRARTEQGGHVRSAGEGVRVRVYAHAYASREHTRGLESVEEQTEYANTETTRVSFNLRLPSREAKGDGGGTGR